MMRGNKGLVVGRGLLTAAALLTLVTLLGGSTGANAQAMSSTAIPTQNSQPFWITVGPDGALWFTEFHGNNIGRLTTSGAISEFAVPTFRSGPSGIVAGSDGNLWFVEQNASNVGRITTSGQVTEFPTPTPNSMPTIIAAGSDGNLWFVEQNGNNVGRITTAGAITEFEIPTPKAFPEGIAAGSDGALWFTEYGGNKIGRITTTGSFAEYLLPGSFACPLGITAGPDGNLWFTGPCNNTIGLITVADGAITQFNSQIAGAGIATGPDGALWFTQYNNAGNELGQLTTQGVVALFQVTSPGTFLGGGITAGPEGALWFANPGANSIGLIAPPPATSPLVAAVLPSSQSVQLGTPATAFATIINAGSAGLNGCAIAPVTTVPASFLYQTTNPMTNTLTGSPNTPVSIAAGAAQTFVIALTPTAPVAPTTVSLGFSCSGTTPAPTTPGVNTLLYSASATPVPDIIALAATTSNDGILHVVGPSNANAFAVATINLGASAAITATPNTGSAALPLAIGICQTNPTSGQCLSGVGGSATAVLDSQTTATFAIFATAGGSVPFAPATNRIFVEFTDSSGVVRGSTSVAVETQ
jgi:streptogramin lyase